MAEVTCIVDTDGTQSPDYTSLSAAIAGETGASPAVVTGADLVTNDEQLTIECRASGAHAADTTGVNITGFTTDVDCYVKVCSTGSYRHSGKWNDNLYQLKKSGNGEGYNNFWLTNNYTVLEGLQIYRDGYQGLGVAVIGDNCIVDGCIIRGVYDGNSSWGALVAIDYGENGSVTVRNSLLYDGNSGYGTCAAIHAPSDGSTNGTVVVENCTICHCAGQGIAHNAGSMTVRNTVIFDTADDISGTVTLTYCAGDDADFGSGTGNIQWADGATDWAANFTDYANGDFSVKDTDADIYHAGTDLDLDYDIAGNAWHATTPSIGAFEYVAAGGGSISKVGGTNLSAIAKISGIAKATIKKIMGIE